MTSLQASPDPDSQFSEADTVEPEPEMSLEQFLDGVVEVTIAVLSGKPEKKGEWWQALGEFHTQARRHADRDRMAFFDALRQLVEGASPERLSALVPKSYKQYWYKILKEIS
jgi:hypothetical protein